MTICLHATKMRWLQPGEAAMMNARGGDLDMLLDDDDSGRWINWIRHLNRGAAQAEILMGDLPGGALEGR